MDITSKGVTIGLVLLEIVLTGVKTKMFKNGYLESGWFFFLCEAEMGMFLTILAGLGIQKKKSSEWEWGSYHIAMPVIAGVYEFSVIVFEAFVLNLNYPSTEQRTERHQTWKDWFTRWPAFFAMFIPFAPCVGVTVYVAIARRGLEKIGNFSVELCLFISFLVAILNLVMLFYLVASDDVPIKFSFFLIFIIPLAFSVCGPIAAAIVTATKHVYVDAGLVTLMAVLLPGSFSLYFTVVATPSMNSTEGMYSSESF